MKFAIIGPDATDADLARLILDLRTKQRRAVIPSTRDELGADIDEVLDLMSVRRALGSQAAH